LKPLVFDGASYEEITKLKKCNSLDYQKEIEIEMSNALIYIEVKELKPGEFAFIDHIRFANGTPESTTETVTVITDGITAGDLGSGAIIGALATIEKACISCNTNQNPGSRKCKRKSITRKQFSTHKKHLQQ